MAAKPLDIHPAALDELKYAVTWYSERSETATINFVREVDDGLEMVVQSPSRWPSGEHGTRKFALKRFPFAIIYRETDASVQVLAVAHGRRQPGYWKKRL